MASRNKEYVAKHRSRGSNYEPVEVRSSDQLSQIEIMDSPDKDHTAQHQPGEVRGSDPELAGYKKLASRDFKAAEDIFFNAIIAIPEKEYERAANKEKVADLFVGMAWAHLGNGDVEGARCDRDKAKSLDEKLCEDDDFAKLCKALDDGEGEDVPGEAVQGEDEDVQGEDVQVEDEQGEDGWREEYEITLSKTHITRALNVRKEEGQRLLEEAGPLMGNLHMELQPEDNQDRRVVVQLRLNDDQHKYDINWLPFLKDNPGWLNVGDRVRIYSRWVHGGLQMKVRKLEDVQGEDEDVQGEDEDVQGEDVQVEDEDVQGEDEDVQGEDVQGEDEDVQGEDVQVEDEQGEVGWREEYEKTLNKTHITRALNVRKEIGQRLLEEAGPLIGNLHLELQPEDNQDRRVDVQLYHNASQHKYDINWLPFLKNNPGWLNVGDRVRIYSRWVHGGLQMMVQKLAQD